MPAGGLASTTTPKRGALPVFKSTRCRRVLGSLAVRTAASAVLFTSEMSSEASAKAPRPKEPTVRNWPRLGEITGVSPSREPCITSTPKARSMA